MNGNWELRKLHRCRTMLNAEERRLYLHQCGGGSDGPRRCHAVIARPELSSTSAVASSKSLAALRVSRKYRQAAVRRREYRKLKAIVPAVSAKHAVSKVRIPTGRYGRIHYKVLWNNVLSHLNACLRCLFDSDFWTPAKLISTTSTLGV